MPPLLADFLIPSGRPDCLIRSWIAERASLGSFRVSISVSLVIRDTPRKIYDNNSAVGLLKKVIESVESIKNRQFQLKWY